MKVCVTLPVRPSLSSGSRSGGGSSRDQAAWPAGVAAGDTGPSRGTLWVVAAPLTIPLERPQSQRSGGRTTPPAEPAVEPPAVEPYSEGVGRERFSAEIRASFSSGTRWPGWADVLTDQDPVQPRLRGGAGASRGRQLCRWRQVAVESPIAAPPAASRGHIASEAIGRRPQQTARLIVSSGSDDHLPTPVPAREAIAAVAALTAQHAPLASPCRSVERATCGGRGPERAACQLCRSSAQMATRRHCSPHRSQPARRLRALEAEQRAILRPLQGGCGGPHFPALPRRA